MINLLEQIKEDIDFLGLDISIEEKRPDKEDPEGSISLCIHPDCDTLWADNGGRILLEPYWRYIQGSRNGALAGLLYRMGYGVI